jgi:hypothetical protein
MKYFLATTLFFCLSICLNAQVDPIVHPNKKSDVFNYSVLENKPLFGGAKNYEESEELLRAYVQVRIDSLSFEEGLKAYVSFVIDTDGSMKNVELSYGKNSQLNQKAMEKISKLPKWQSASKNGEAVKSSFILDIKT